MHETPPAAARAPAARLPGCGPGGRGNPELPRPPLPQEISL